MSEKMQQLKMEKKPYTLNRSDKTLAWAIAFLVLLVELALSYWLVFEKDYVMKDAFSRTANAYFILFVKPRRLASVGFVWNPLPSILELPLVAFAGYFRPLASKALAGSILTSFCAAASAWILIRTFLKFQVNPFLSVLITLLYALNPFIAFYGSNGMSEGIFFTGVIYIVSSLVLWKADGKSKHMIELAFGLAILFYVRYEAIPFAAAIAACVLLQIIASKQEAIFWEYGGKKEHWAYAEGTLFVLLTPIAYAVLLWIILNWMIIGSPFYFMNSTYSNVSQSLFSRDYGGTMTILAYILPRALPFLILFLALMLIRLFNGHFFRYSTLQLFILVFTMLAFHFYMMKTGSSFGWLRFFSYSLPICIAWTPYDLKISRDWRFLHAETIVIIGLAISAILCSSALKNQDLAKEEFNTSITEETYIIADYINNELPESKILMDSFLTNTIIVNIDNIDNIICSSSANFKEIAADPIHSEADYLLLPDSEGTGSLDVFNINFPDIYQSGAEWCKVVKRFDSYKLFQIIR